MPIDEKVMLRAATVAFKRSRRLLPIVGYTDDEAMQDARIGAWKASDREYQDAVHAFRGMVLAGYRSILDGRSRRYSASDGGNREVPLEDEDSGYHVQELGYGSQGFSGLDVSNICQEYVSVREVLQKIETLKPPLPKIARMLMEGHSTEDIAKDLGVVPSRVSQHSRVLRTLISKMTGLTR